MRENFIQSLMNSDVSFIPIRLDGTKRPLWDWKSYQTRKPSAQEAFSWQNDNCGFGIVAGAVSGHLEVIDIDEPALCESFKSRLCERGGDELFSRLLVVRTPRDGGGWHLYYRCRDGIQPNQVLARYVLPDQKVKTAIETRGEGGYTIAPGNPASVHPSGVAYKIEQGSIERIPDIRSAERNLLFEVARSFNLVQPEHRMQLNVPSRHSNVGNRFAENISWAEILERHGWTLVKTTEENVHHWQKPNSSDSGIHATVNHDGRDQFYVFSDSTGHFEQGRYYDKFTVYTLLNFDGDFDAAAAELKQNGLRDYDQTEVGNSEHFVDDHGDCLAFVPENGTWYLWDGICWKQDKSESSVRELGKATAKRILEEAHRANNPDARRKRIVWAKKTNSLYGIKSMITLSESALSRSLTEFDEQPMLLNCANGIVDLRTGNLIPHDKNRYLTMSIKYSYNPEATCPRFLEFIDTIFGGNRALINYVQTAAGYCLSDSQQEQCLYFCHGSGSNGKSTLVGIFLDVLGPYAQAGAPGLLLKAPSRNNSNDIARLKGKRLVVCSETGKGNVFDETRLKQLTGGDKVSARYLHKEFFEFAPTHHFWLLSNNKPRFVPDFALKRRIKLIPFEVRIPEDEKDSALPEKLKLEAEGILAWMVKGALRWSAEGLVEPDEVMAASEKYADEMDEFKERLSSFYVDDSNGKIPSSQLLVCMKNVWEGETMTSSKLKSEMESRGYKHKVEKNGSFYLGLRRIELEDEI